jgi:hypothetical protein
MARHSTRFAIALASALTIVAAGAQAQDKASQPADPLVFGTDATYEVKFSDDPLAALPNGVIIATINVRPPVGYARLHRPRTQFVREMLKSTDTL